MKNRLHILLLIVLAPLLMGNQGGCSPSAGEAVSSTGVRRATANIQKGTDGLTVEQRNVKKRLELDNKPGSIKHLYLFSAYTGQCIFYSTVEGKVTSSGKRLQPVTVTPRSTGDALDYMGFSVDIGGTRHYTSEVLQDDGTYGSSIPYLYWWDANGKYMQVYVTGGSTLMISDQPIAVRRTTVNLSIKTDKTPDFETRRPPVRSRPSALSSSSNSAVECVYDMDVDGGSIPPWGMASHGGTALTSCSLVCDRSARHHNGLFLADSLTPSTETGCRLVP